MQIKKYPAKVLRQKSQSINEITQREKNLFEDMLLTMRRYSGIGLAAPQVGINQRLIVAEVAGGRVKLANPELIEVKGKSKMEESCLSVPAASVNIVRPYEAVVKGLNENGKSVQIEAKGLLARVLMHEIDHLNGRLILDYMNFLQKLRYNLNKRRKA